MGQGTVSVNGISLHQVIWQALTEKAGDNLLFRRQFGKATNLTANTKQAIWDSTGYMTFLTAAETIRAVSTSAEDTNTTGTGAHIVRIRGLDNNWNLIEEDLPLAGLGNADTVQQFLRIYDIIVIDAGSTESNVGIITFTAVASAALQQTIIINAGSTASSYFSVPAGYTAIIIDELFNVFRTGSVTGAARGAEFDHIIRVEGVTQNTHVTFRAKEIGMRTDGLGAMLDSPAIPDPIPEKTDFYYAVTADANSTSVIVKYTILLIKGNFTENVTFL